MSNFQAIGGVSETLRTLLRDRMEMPTGVLNVPVTILPPQEDQDGDAAEDPQVNLFLYRVTENGSLKNQEIPGSGHPAAYGHPPLSLDLHYLLTAYGTTLEEDFFKESRAQDLLGSAMRVLHDFPIVTEQLLTVRPPAGQVMLHTSLRGEFERVKITLDPINLEDLSKIWTALTLSYRLSAAYTVSVVQIESQRPRVFPRPVGELPAQGPRVYALPFSGVRIDEIRVQWGAAGPEKTFPYARIGDRLILIGRGFGTTSTRVILGDVDATASVTRLQDARIELTVPDVPALRTGPLPVRVVRDLLLGEPPLAHRGFQSNTCVLMLVPHISSLLPDLAAAPRTLEVNGTRLFDASEECLAIVGAHVIRSLDYTVVTPTQIAFDLPASVGTGDHLVRVRVGGAESVDDQVLSIP